MAEQRVAAVLGGYAEWRGDDRTRGLGLADDAEDVAYDARRVRLVLGVDEIDKAPAAL